MFFGFAVRAGAGFAFCCLGGGAGPAQTAKKTTRPRPNSKTKKTRPCPLRAFFFAVCAGGRVYVFAVWAEGRFFFAVLGCGVLCFFAVWARACLCFCCLGGVRVFFAVWAEDMFFFWLFGRGAGVHSLTGLPGLSLSDPTTKTDQTAKKTRVPP